MKRLIDELEDSDYLEYCYAYGPSEPRETGKAGVAGIPENSGD